MTSILHTIFICMRLRSISEPMDAGKFVELCFDIPACGEVQTGELRMRVKATDAGLWLVGDEYSLKMRRS